MKRTGFTHESTYNESQEWYTPKSIFDALRLRFDLDPASPGAAIVPWIPAAKHLTYADDGLTTPWAGCVWLNPPYGSDTPAWVRRFVTQPVTGVMLVFARSDTAWFHDWAVKCDAMLFIRGRVKFIRSDGFCGQGCGAASMLLARGGVESWALKRSGLGFYMDLCRSRDGYEAEVADVERCGAGYRNPQPAIPCPSADTERGEPPGDSGSGAGRRKPLERMGLFGNRL